MKRTYYAVIPAKVRYDKRLPLGARLIYGEVTALCNDKGFCWASNKYFADMYEQGERTVSRWISQLAKCKYIKVEIKGTDRKIWIMDEMKYHPVDDDGNEKPIKGPKVRKEPKNAIAVRLREKFGDLCQKYLGTRPVSDVKGYVRVCFALNEKGGNLTEKQVLDLFDEWFKMGKPDVETISLSRALTNLNITGYKVRNHVK